MYTQQDKTSYNMQEYSWLQTVSVSAERYGNSSDTGNPLWYQSHCLQMLWWTSWKTTAENTFAHLESTSLIISKSLSTEVYLSCQDYAKAPCNNAENSCISLVFIKKARIENPYISATRTRLCSLWQNQTRCKRKGSFSIV